LLDLLLSVRQVGSHLLSILRLRLLPSAQLCYWINLRLSRRLIGLRCSGGRHI
jgi:hypothetical protein